LSSFRLPQHRDEKQIPDLTRGRLFRTYVVSSIHRSKRLILERIVDKFPLNLVLEIRFMTDDSTQLEQCIG